MLDSASAHAMIGVKDLSRAKEFYSDKLGLRVADELPAGAIRYAARGGTWFLVYQSQFAGTAKTTCMRFEVDDIEAVVTELRDRGVVFEEYDLPELKTVGGSRDTKAVLEARGARIPTGTSSRSRSSSAARRTSGCLLRIQLPARKSSHGGAMAASGV